MMVISKVVSGLVTAPLTGSVKESESASPVWPLPPVRQAPVGSGWPAGPVAATRPHGHGANAHSSCQVTLLADITTTVFLGIVTLTLFTVTVPPESTSAGLSSVIAWMKPVRVKAEAAGGCAYSAADAVPDHRSCVIITTNHVVLDRIGLPPAAP